MSDDLMNREFLIFKRGRGWYRPESQGYTAFKFEAGRYTQQEAEKITHPNGLDGPRDGMFYKHENEVSDIPSARIEQLEAENARLINALTGERLENLWNAYNTGHEKDGEWSHHFMSDGEWLVRECGLDPKTGRYDAAEIKALIPQVAIRAAQIQED